MSAPASDRPGWSHDERTFAQLPGVDPDVEWALGSGRDTFFGFGRQQRWVPVLVELQGISVDEFAAGTSFLDDGPSRTMWQASVRVSKLYDAAVSGESRSAFCTAVVTQGFFEFLKFNESLQKVVAGVTLSLPVDLESLAPGPSGAAAGQAQS